MPNEQVRVESTQHERRFMKEFNIEFVGPVPPSEWPAAYERRFAPVRKIGRYYFEDLDKVSMDEDDKMPKVPSSIVQQRVFELRQSFFLSSDDPVNEDTLRGNSEHLVFSRFKDEVKW